VAAHQELTLMRQERDATIKARQEREDTIALLKSQMLEKDQLIVNQAGELQGQGRRIADLERGVSRGGAAADSGNGAELLRQRCRLCSRCSSMWSVYPERTCRSTRAGHLRCRRKPGCRIPCPMSGGSWTITRRLGITRAYLSMISSATQRLKRNTFGICGRFAEL
jgi:hypothetical protein